MVAASITRPAEVEKRKVAELAGVAKQAFATRIPNALVEDLAFVGNASGVYPWDPGRLVDLDVCLFVPQRDAAVGRWIAELRDSIADRIAGAADFDLRLIVGPYKPPVMTLERPFIFVHLAALTTAEYADTPALLRWSWRKYRCLVEADRLRRLAPDGVRADDVAARVAKLLARLESGQTTMREWLLPDFREAAVHLTWRDPNFAEVCFSSVATCTRHHARALGHPEADALANRDFFRWYGECVLRSAALTELAALKERSRDEGFGALLAPARELSIVCLRELARLC